MFQSQLMKARSPTIAYIILVIVILKLRTVQKGSNPHQCSQLQKWARSIEHKHWSDMIVEASSLHTVKQQQQMRIGSRPIVSRALDSLIQPYTHIWLLEKSINCTLEHVLHFFQII